MAAPTASWMPRSILVGHAAAGVVVVAGVAAQLIRPLAPQLGPPPDPASLFDVSYLTRAEAYRDPLYAAGLASLAIRVGVPVLAVLTPAGRRAIAALGRVGGARRPALSAVAVAVGIGLATELVRLPLAFWAGYVHEGVWGFRTQGLGGWALDWLRARVLGAVGIAVLAGGAVIAVRRVPRAWMPVGGLLAAAASVLVIFAAPRVLEPLEHRLTPLPPGPLRDEVERVLAAADVEVSEILVADASRRTTKQNAYVSGLGATRRVVLYDTLVAGQSPEQVGVVLAHELGHDRNRDIERNAALAAAGTVAGAYAIGGLMWLRRRRGLPGDTSPRAVAAAVAAVVLIQAAGLPADTWLSRRAEAAADYASLQLTGAPDVFVAMQAELARANLADPSPPGWAYLLWWTHPTTAERMGMGLQWEDRAR